MIDKESFQFSERKETMDNFGQDVNKSLLPSNAETYEDQQLSHDVFELKRNESLHDIGGGAPVPSIKKRKRNLRPRQMPSDSSSSSTLSGSVPNLPDTIGKEDFYDAYGSLHEFKDDKVTTILAQDLDQELKETSNEQTVQSQKPSGTPRQSLNISGRSPTSK